MQKFSMLWFLEQEEKRQRANEKACKQVFYLLVTAFGAVVLLQMVIGDV
ncbi:hypothetical protein [Thalassospira aquimaris]|uniref:TMhelix containing protein n=1 Tax=Thalassospira aquimaris TaxID=3037796 RepID=A0ABT6GHP0_9PROT|nr:hypothetical protein [Thalassospira sp. FZY0004]MDG4721601.1 hypothetical protein [Thalassospira sp. FZY0004]